MPCFGSLIDVQDVHGFVIQAIMLSNLQLTGVVISSSSLTTRKSAWHLAVVFALAILSHCTYAKTDTCKHRYDYRYHQNPTIHNPYLRQALEDYTLFHINATSGTTTSVADELVRIAMHENGSGNDVHRYLYLDLSASGLGNRLNTLLSGFLYAVLSRRVLLISSAGYR